jgi:hypothetical protein
MAGVHASDGGPTAQPWCRTEARAAYVGTRTCLSRPTRKGYPGQAARTPEKARSHPDWFRASEARWRPQAMGTGSVDLL